MPACDVIVVGSGPAGVHAALPLLEAGLQVTMLDGAVRGPKILEEPTENFEDMRRRRNDQWRWFLGEDLSAIPTNGLRGGLGGGMTSGNRAFVTQKTEALPLETKNAQIVQTLALGGLGAVWGATSAYLSKEHLERMGLSAEDMEIVYREVTKIIGVSGPDSGRWTQPPMDVDHHAKAFLESRSSLDASLELVQPCTAMLTQPLETRAATKYADMDYYSDHGRSVYRPQWTVEEMQKHRNFSLEGGVTVESVEETPDGVVVKGTDLDSGEQKTWRATRVVLAAGALNTARILLKSNVLKGSVPCTVKPHAFIAALRLGALGTTGPKARTSLCQLVLLEQKTAGLCAQLYSYRSLLLFRLLSAIPLPTPLALRIASLLSPALIVCDVRFSTLGASNANVSLEGETLRVEVRTTEDDEQMRHRALAKVRGALRSLGALPLKTMLLPEGSSSHYAGTVPIGTHADGNGHVRGLRNIVVADASCFAYLPALPHTLTIMANARRIGKLLAGELHRSRS